MAKELECPKCKGRKVVDQTLGSMETGKQIRCESCGHEFLISNRLYEMLSYKPKQVRPQTHVQKAHAEPLIHDAEIRCTASMNGMIGNQLDGNDNPLILDAKRRAEASKVDEDVERVSPLLVDAETRAA